MPTTHTERIRFEVPSDLRYGEAARAMLDRPNKTLGVSSCSEAFDSVIWHAYRGLTLMTIKVDVVVSSILTMYKDFNQPLSLTDEDQTAV